jgi:ABC-type sugar transport system permease subunit
VDLTIGDPMTATTPVRRIQGVSSKRSLTGWLCASPIILYVLFWTVLPIAFAFIMVFTDWRGFEDLSQMTFIGLDNIKEMLRDRYYLAAYKNSFTYAVYVIIGGIGLGLILALTLNKINKWVGFVRIIYYMPVILPGTAMALLWKLMYEPRYGLFNQTLMQIGLKPIPWLFNPATALLSVCIYVVWKNVGWYMVMLLAGLKNIPQEYYEAAAIDGASGWQQFRFVTVPLLKPTLLFLTTMAIIGSMQVFNTVYMMTGGGPAGSTTTVVLHMYSAAFDWLRTSYSTAMAVGLFLVIFVVTRIQMKLYGEGGMFSYY